MTRFLTCIGLGLLGLAAVLALIIGVSAAILAFQPEPRGRMVEIAQGRRLRLVCEGPARPSTPVVWLEAGAWGGAADWGAVQEKLTAAGLRSCAYDRAGLGYSDPGPAPRDARAITSDLDRLITLSGEKGPFILVAHSAGGLYLRAFTGLRPDLVRGIVLVDAMTPEAVRAPPLSQFMTRFRDSAHWLAIGSSLGLTKPVALTAMADRIGLPDAARVEKRHGLASGRHNRASADEVDAWPAAIEQAGATPLFKREWPVAVVTAKREGMLASYDSARSAPARASAQGRVDVVEGAEHRTLLGPYGDHIIEAVKFVAR